LATLHFPFHVGTWPCLAMPGKGLIRQRFQLLTYQGMSGRVEPEKGARQVGAEVLRSLCRLRDLGGLRCLGSRRTAACFRAAARLAGFCSTAAPGILTRLRLRLGTRSEERRVGKGCRARVGVDLVRG